MDFGMERIDNKETSEAGKLPNPKSFIQTSTHNCLVGCLYSTCHRVGVSKKLLHLEVIARTGCLASSENPNNKVLTAAQKLAVLS